MYIGSFNGVKPIREDINPQCKPLFEKEQGDLLADLHEIPVRSCDRKVPRLCSGFHGQARHCVAPSQGHAPAIHTRLDIYRLKACVRWCRHAGSTSD